ncbi:MAG: hypothetical protein U9Q06_04740 [Nanoarchaeota archaeon]|nr:hypothetical protein [Nanoarchaeota archaeon]
MNIIKKLGIGSLIALTGCATVPGNIARTGANAMLMPVKVIKSTVNNYNPVQGLREGVVDTGEAVYDTVTGKEFPRQPHELGVANEFINERPGLKAVIDIGVAIGAGAAAAEFAGAGVVHMNQTMGYAAGGQAIVEGANAYSNR